MSDLKKKQQQQQPVSSAYVK